MTVLDDDLQRMLSARLTPALQPMLLPTPALIAVVDTNVLASRACHAVRYGLAGDAVLSGLATTGRSNTFMGAHVPGELVRRLSEVAESTHVDLASRHAGAPGWHHAQGAGCRSETGRLHEPPSRSVPAGRSNIAPIHAR